MQITVTYQPSQEELRRSRWQKSGTSSQSLTLGLLLFNAGIGILLGVVGSPFWYLWSVYCLAMLVLTLVMPGRLIAKYASRLCIPTEATFTPETFAFRTPLGSALYRWEVLERSTEGKDFFFLFVTRRSAAVIPKRAFTSEQIAGLQYILATAPFLGKPVAGRVPAGV